MVMLCSADLRTIEFGVHTWFWIAVLAYLTLWQPKAHHDRLNRGWPYQWISFNVMRGTRACSRNCRVPPEPKTRKLVLFVVL